MIHGEKAPLQKDVNAADYERLFLTCECTAICVEMTPPPILMQKLVAKRQRTALSKLCGK